MSPFLPVQQSPRHSRLGPPASALPPRPSRLGPPASALPPRTSLTLAKAIFLTSLTFLGLLLCTLSACAQSGYPGGGSGSGYPGGGSGGYPGGGSSPDPGHNWKITYSGSGTTSYAIPSGYGGSTPYSDPWGHWNYGAFWGVISETDINGSCTGTVTATLTWIPTAGMTLLSDPPAKMVSIIEASSASDNPGTWDGGGPAPVGVGSASNGLGDAQVPSGSGFTCSGSHRVKKDGSSGTITLGPFTLTATCPVSNWAEHVELFEGNPLLSYY